MEAATVMRLAKIHGVGFRAIKVISDEAEFEIAGMEKFANRDGQFREGAFAAHVAVRPWMWGKVVRLARNSQLAVGRLHEVLCEELKAAVRG